MDIALLKEPLGSIRFLQWIFAAAAFFTCATFRTQIGYQISCNINTTNITSACFNVKVVQYLKYPFKLYDIPNEITTSETYNATDCLKNESTNIHPGEYIHLDAQFFVLIGVIAWIVSAVSLVVYVFYPYYYINRNSKAPVADLWISVILLTFWLAASSSWAHGLFILKNTTDETWIFSYKYSPCYQEKGKFMNKNITGCFWYNRGSFGAANASILLGFLNVFLWACNLWFIYKETKWYGNRNPAYN